jgi:hypothetical protein
MNGHFYPSSLDNSILTAKELPDRYSKHLPRALRCGSLK